MSAVFADTYYWIALTNIQDLAHASVTAFTRQTKPDTVCTTEEVLTEYLNYFAAWGSALSASSDAQCAEHDEQSKRSGNRTNGEFFSQRV